MKKVTIKLMVIAAFLAVPVTWIQAQQTQQATEFDLEQCIEYALQNNIDAKNANIEEQKSEAQVKEFTALGLPQLNANVGFTHNLTVQTSFIPDFISPATYGVLFEEGLLAEKDLGEPATLPAAFGTKFNGSLGVSLSQLILDGSYFVGLKAARTIIELSNKQSTMTDIQVAENVSKAYYGVLVSQQKLELFAKNFSRIDSLLRDTEILEQNGFVEKIDVSRIKVTYNNTKTALTTSRDMLSITISLLKFQMGMPVNNKLILTESLKDLTLSNMADEGEDFEYENRIEFSILETSDVLNDLDIKNYKMQYMPRLYGFLNAGYTSGTSEFSDMTNFNSDTWFDYQNWGLSLNIPIFDGFQKKHTIQQRKLNKLQIQNRFESVKNTIDLNIQTSRITVVAKKNALDVQQENMELATEVVRITQIKYKEGVGSNAEVLDADTALKESQTNYYNALYEALVAKIDLEKAYGTLLKNNN